MEITCLILLPEGNSHFAHQKPQCSWFSTPIAHTTLDFTAPLFCFLFLSTLFMILAILTGTKKKKILTYSNDNDVGYGHVKGSVSNVTA